MPTSAVASNSENSASRRIAVKCFESLSPIGIRSADKRTAAALTGPANGPRPTSSTPTTYCRPRANAATSCAKSGEIGCMGRVRAKQPVIATKKGREVGSSRPSTGATKTLGTVAPLLTGHDPKRNTGPRSCLKLERISSRPGADSSRHKSGSSRMWCATRAGSATADRGSGRHGQDSQRCSPAPSHSGSGI